jgi:hypothetical protein
MAVPVVVVVALCLLPGSSVYRSLTGVGGERRRPLVCLGAVKPFVYTDGTRVPWRRLAARSLSIPLPPPSPDADGVVALGGLGCAVPLGFDDGCRGVGSLRVAFRPHPDAGGIVWSLPCTSIRLQSIIGN